MGQEVEREEKTGICKGSCKDVIGHKLDSVRDVFRKEIVRGQVFTRTIYEASIMVSVSFIETEIEYTWPLHNE